MLKGIPMNKPPHVTKNGKRVDKISTLYDFLVALMGPKIISLIDKEDNTSDSIRI